MKQAPTSGSNHKSAQTCKRPRSEPAPPMRRSKRQKADVHYDEGSDDDEIEGSCAGNQAECTEQTCMLPQCTGHGIASKKQSGHSCMLAAVHEHRDNDMMVLVEYPVQVDAQQGRERVRCERRRGQAPRPQAGRFARGRKHRIDIVLARRHADGSVNALAGWEVQDKEHERADAMRADERKSAWAGFHIEPVPANAQKWECDMAYHTAVHECM